jgi:ParB family chromosome partitioning protein
MSSELRTIPLSQLKASKANVRKTDRSADIEQMAASIESNGLLENLVVRSAANGRHPSYEVIAGGRRFAALKLLAKREKIERAHPVACLVLDDASDVTEISLAENFARVPLHPADQFEAFAALVGAGQSTDDIAARFGIAAAFVQQRLKLAAVSPRLVAEYRSGAMTLEQLTAFTLSDDPALQESTWFESPYAALSPAMIRRLLTQTQVETSDRRVLFVGSAAYEAAGGAIVRDLFDSDSDGYIADSQLLERLVQEKLEAAAASVRTEGWQWVEVHADADVARVARYRRATATPVALSPEEDARLSELGERYDALVAELEEDQPSEALGAVAAEIDTLRAKQEVWSDAAKANAGAVIGIEWDGSLFISRGLVQETEAPEGPDAPGRQSKRLPRDGYSDGIVLDLSAHRTAALRAVVADRPALALQLLLHAFVEQLLFTGRGCSCLTIHASEVSLEGASPSVGEGRAAEMLEAQQARWTETLPSADQVWDWLGALESDRRLELLAHCVARTISTLERPGQSTGRDAARLMTAANLDMSSWWRPTVANFFGRLNKAEILAAVAEGVSPSDARHLEGAKKDVMAIKAEKLLAPTNWVPKPFLVSGSDTRAST